MTEYVLLSVMFAIIIIVVVLPVYIFTRPLLKELKELNEETEQMKSLGKKKYLQINIKGKKENR